MIREGIPSVATLFCLLFIAPVSIGAPTDVLAVPGSEQTLPIESPRSVRSNSTVVSIAQYGAPEDMGTFRNGGFKAVRFDPPFVAPYVISKIRFPSVTTNGVQALFSSIRILGADERGRPLLADGLFQVSPFAGSPDGVNEIPVSIEINQPNRILYLAFEFPPTSQVAFPNDFPFLRADYLDMERGFFANSYDITPSGAAILLPDRNIVASMEFTLPNIDQVPISPTRDFGANRIRSSSSPLGRLEFSYVLPDDVVADGGEDRIQRVDIIYRDTPFGPWKPWISGGPRRSSVTADSFPNAFITWASQVVGKNGVHSIISNVSQTSRFVPGLDGQGDDQDEPNGRLQDATVLTLPLMMRQESYWPAGDQDYYAIQASAGETIDVDAARIGPTAANPVDLVAWLYDQNGTLLTVDDNSGGLTSPHLVYHVPPGRGGSHRFVVKISDTYGTSVMPGTAPRVISPIPLYYLSVAVHPSAEGATFSAQAEAHHLTVAPNPSRSSFTFSLGATRGAVAPDVKVFTATGRLLRSIRGNGAPIVVWDGRDDAGRQAPAGIYFARYHGAVGTETKRLVLLK